MRFRERRPELCEFFLRAIRATIADHEANGHYAAIVEPGGGCWECDLLKLVASMLPEAEVIYEYDKGAEGIVYEFRDDRISDRKGHSLVLVPTSDYPGRMPIVDCDPKTGLPLSAELAPKQGA